MTVLREATLKSFMVFFRVLIVCPEWPPSMVQALHTHSLSSMQ